MSDKIQGKILIVDDNEDLLKAAKLFLKRHFTRIDTTPDPHQIIHMMHQERYDVILLDMNFTKDVDSGMEGFYWLDQIQQLDPASVIVLITAYGKVDLAVKAIKEGATDFVTKPWDNDKLLATLISALRLKQSKEELSKLRLAQEQIHLDQDKKFKEIVGNSPAMIKVFDLMERVAPTDANILILGENGTGKEVMARAIHRQSNRTDKAFVSVDLGAISESLFESELFGHVKGAFTDAKEDRMGRFEMANGGTLFLDEIGNLSLALQKKLLTAIQKREIVRVGGNQVIPVDIRLICATNMNIYEMVDEGTFRQDLLYRINTIELNLPPLRERLDDIPLLVEYFTSIYSKKYKKDIVKVHPSAIKRMMIYQWPGNIRELQHAVERAVIMCADKLLQIEDFYFSNRPTSSTDSDKMVIENYNLEEMEKMLIRKALDKHHGNYTKAAEELGLTRTSLYRRINKYGL